MLLPSQDIYYISKPEKFFFSLAVVMYVMYQGVLAISLYYDLPNSYISAFMRLFPTVIAGVLFFNSLMNGDFGRMDWTVALQFVYLAYFFVVLFFARFDSFTEIRTLQYGKLFMYYSVIAVNIFPFLLFFMPPRRFFYLANNPWLVFAPALFSVVVLFVLFRGMFFEGTSSSVAVSEGVNRATTTYVIALLFFMSLYYIVFSMKLYKVLIALCTLVFSGVMIMKSSSQSLLVSCFLILVVTLLYSFKDRRSFIIMLFVSVVGLTASIPYLLLSKGFERLSNIVDVGLFYTYGGEYDVSRIDLAKQGFDLFLSSPIFGGYPFLPDGSYTHFFLVDMIMAAGILGILMIFAIFYITARFYLVSFARMPVTYVWIVMYVTFEGCQILFHGGAVSNACMAFGLIFTLHLIYNNTQGRLPVPMQM